MGTPDALDEGPTKDDPKSDRTSHDSQSDDPSHDTTRLEQTVHSDPTQPLDTTPQLESTQQLDQTGATRSLPVDEPAGTRSLFDRDPADRTVGSEPVGAAAPGSDGVDPWPPVLPERPTGPHAPAIVLGLVCVAVAGIILAQELGDLTVDWGNIGPFGIVAVGAVLVLFGLMGLLSSRRGSKTR